MMFSKFLIPTLTSESHILNNYTCDSKKKENKEKQLVIKYLKKLNLYKKYRSVQNGYIKIQILEK